VHAEEGNDDEEPDGSSGLRERVVQEEAWEDLHEIPRLLDVPPCPELHCRDLLLPPGHVDVHDHTAAQDLVIDVEDGRTVHGNDEHKRLHGHKPLHNLQR
jgi:hypothetical protein